MKKIFTYVLLLSFCIATISSCGFGKNSTKGGGKVVKTVSTVAGVILLSKLLKSILNNVTESSTFAGLSQDNQFMKNFNEETKLNSFAQNDLTEFALKLLVADKYEIPFATVVNNYNTLNTAGELATFIGENADAQILSDIK